MPMLFDLKSQTLSSHRDSNASPYYSKASTEANEIPKNMTLQEKLNISN